MKLKAFLFPLFLLFILSCKKSENTPTPPPQQDNYQAISAGSTWNYHSTDSSGLIPFNEDFTLTSTSRDSSINGKSYHIFNNSVAGNQYISISGNDYFQYDSLPAGFGTTVFERLYLKDNAPVGFTWTQSLSVTLSGVPLPVTLTYTIAERGISRTVNGTTYTNVIRVTTSISSSLIPAPSLISNINSYYAEKYGLIETKNVIRLNYLTFVQDINIETKLVSATIL